MFPNEHPTIGLTLGSAEFRRDDDGEISFRLNTFADALGGRLNLSLDQPIGQPTDFWTIGYAHSLTPSLDLARYVKGDEAGWDQGTTQIVADLPLGSVGLSRIVKRDSLFPGFRFGS